MKGEAARFEEVDGEGGGGMVRWGSGLGGGW